MTKTKEYAVWVIVRQCIRIAVGTTESKYATACAFVGKSPPSGFAEHPTRI
ncbi:MAG: hypothetical protein IPI76_13300 [Chloracidobacterium sp.]|nr:hypothetical protein [Chloracidobacterium sp.]